MNPRNIPDGDACARSPEGASDSAEAFAKRVFRAGFWSLALNVAMRLLGLARTVILARLLAPDDIGLFAIAAIVLTLVETFSRTGFWSALIYSQDNIHSKLDTAWTIMVIRGAFRALILWLAAPWVAVFYDQPAVTGLIRVISILMLFHGFTNIGSVYFRKDLEYHKQFIWDFGAAIADLVVVIVTAFLLRNAWALVCGLVARFVLRLALSYLLHPFRPRFRIDWKDSKSLFNYGIWMALTGAVMFLGRQGSGVVLGKITGMTELGYFQMAFWIAEAAISDVILAINDVAFPALAIVQKDELHFRNSCLNTLELAFSIVLPLSATLALAADDIVFTLLGTRWAPMTTALWLMSLAAMTFSVSSAGNPIFLGGGRPNSLFVIQSARAVCVMMFIYPLAARYGASGAAGAMLAGGLGMLLFFFYFIKLQMRLKITSLLYLLKPPLIACSALSLVWLTARGMVSMENVSTFHRGLWALSIAALGFAVYGIVLYIQKPRAVRSFALALFQLKKG